MRELGDFELLEEIGRGGMGVVFRARERSLDRLVALKVMVAGVLASPDALQRFQAEALAAAAMNHPNIVPIYEVGEHDGQAYMSMRLMGNGTIEGRQVAPMKAARLVVLLAKAVQHAHQRGVLHLDLKPANILLDENDDPHLTDFGIAKALDDNDSALTRTQSIVGSPAYLSPEQAAGCSGQLTTATDVYGLGVILYELLTGKPPFSGKTALETIRQVIDAPPDAPASSIPEIDRDLETICLTCLDKEPKTRYASPLALADDLKRWQNGEPIHARPVRWPERSLKWMKRRPYAGALAIVTVLSLLTIAIGGVLFGLRLQKANTLAEMSAQESRALALGLIEDNGVEKMEEGDFFAAMPWLIDALKADSEQPHREALHRTRLGIAMLHSPRLLDQWPIGGVAHFLGESQSIAVVQGTSGKVKMIPLEGGLDSMTDINHGAPCRHVAIHPDGIMIATGGSDQAVRVWDAQSGEQISNDLPAVGVPALKFSSDGRWLAIGDGRNQYTIRLVDTEDWAVRHTWPISFHPRSLVFTPDSKSVIAGGTVRSVSAWDIDTGDLRAAGEANNGFAVSDMVATMDRVFVTTGMGITALNLDRSTLPDLSSISKSGHWLFDIAVSKNRKLIACGGRDTSAQVFAADTGRRLFPPLEHQHAVTGVSFSDDSRLLLTSSGDGAVSVWEAKSGRRLHAPLGHAAEILSASFSHDGSRVLVSTANATLLWSLVTEPLAGTILNLPVVRRAAFADDEGHHLLTVDDANTIHRWDVATGTEVGGVENLSSQGIGRLRFDFELPVTYSERDLKLVEISPGLIEVRNLGTDKAISQPIRHREAITFAMFSEDGEWIITGSADQDARVWDAQTGKAITPPLPTGGEVYNAILSSDKRRLAVFSRNETVSVWRLDPSEDTLEQLATMSPGEWSSIGEPPAEETWGWNAAMQITQRSGIEEAIAMLETVDSDQHRLALQGKFLASHGYPEGAVPKLEAATEAIPERADLWLALGLAQTERELWGEARRCLGNALSRTTTTTATLLIALGESQLNLGNVEEAAVTAAKAMEADPGSAEALELAGSVSEVQRDWQVALAHYEKAAHMRRLVMMPAAAAGSPSINVPTGAGSVPLSLYLNDALEQYPFNPHIALQPLEHLERGLMESNGQSFFIDGAIRLNGTGDVPNAAPYPTAVRGIPIRKKCHRVHFLHTFQHFEKNGEEVASVEFIYADGRTVRLPLRYGYHGYECNYSHGKAPLHKGTSIAWEKEVPGRDVTQSVYKTTWENPFPKSEIVMFHYESAMKITCPILYAVTCD